MGDYEDHLRHIAEPAAPVERRKAVSGMIQGYEALWFAEALLEYAHYGDTDEDVQSGIALGYAEYIDQKVCGERSSPVTLYAHTEVAASTLLDALYNHVPDVGDRREYPMTVFRAVEETAAGMYAHYIEEARDDADLDAPPEPTVIEVDGDEQVAFDPDEAREAYAMMQMERAEAEAMRERERRRERHFDRHGHF